MPGADALRQTSPTVPQIRHENIVTLVVVAVATNVRCSIVIYSLPQLSKYFEPVVEVVSLAFNRVVAPERRREVINFSKIF